jgi:hypothetical protein
MGIAGKPLRIFLVMLFGWWIALGWLMHPHCARTLEGLSFAYISAWCASVLMVNSMASVPPTSPLASRPLVSLIRCTESAPLGLTTLSVMPGVVAIAAFG